MTNKINHNNYELQILGDFDINLNKPQLLWKSAVIELGLHQLIKENTRVTDSTETLIDHVYTNNRDKVLEAKVLKTGISDHYALFYSFSKRINKQPNKGHKTINYRSYKHFNNNNFLQDISRLPFNLIYNITDPSTALETLCKLLLTVIDKHAPLRNKRIKQQTIPDWLTKETMDDMEQFS